MSVSREERPLGGNFMMPCGSNRCWRETRRDRERREERDEGRRRDEKRETRREERDGERREGK